MKSVANTLLILLLLTFSIATVSCEQAEGTSQPSTQSPTYSVDGTLFAEWFPGGVPEAVKACPATGCIIYATSPNVNRNLGTIDPGNKAITIYLGPYVYTVKQITLRKSLRIIGMGASGNLSCNPLDPCNGTSLQSINGNDPVIVLPQYDHAPATNVELSGFRLYGSEGNTDEDAIFLDTSSTAYSGLWYSKFNDIEIFGFAGIGIDIRGRNDNFSSVSQWLFFNNVVVFRTPGGGNALRIEGSVFELRFTDCEFDGQAIGDGTNIYIGGLAGGSTAFPLNITFEGLISQAAALAVHIDGGENINFHYSHHEKLWGAYKITDDFNIGTRGVTIADCDFAGDVGKNSGSGYLLDVATTLAQNIAFVRNRIIGNPDSVVKAVNLADVFYQDNLYGLYGDSSGMPNVPPTSGITQQIDPADTINIQGAHSVGLNASSTPITTIQSSLGPGERVTFFTISGPVEFASGGNVDLMGTNTVTVNGSITLVREDLLGGLQWVPVSQWSPPTQPAQPTAASQP